MSGKIKITVFIIGLFAFVYLFPRILLRFMDPGDPWLNYLYQYGFGLITFLIGMKVILSSKALQIGRGHDAFWLKVLIGGFVSFAALHAIWILTAQNATYYGG